MKNIIFPEIYKNENGNKIVAVLGKFELIHLGHKQLIKKGRDIANEIEGDLMLMMFSQRPLNNFYTLEERVMLASQSKIDYVLEFEPTQENFSKSWVEFNAYLKDMGVTNVVCGHDFGYGDKREGNADTLSRDFEVEVIPEFLIDDIPVRTSNVLEAVKNDDLETFRKMMSHYFFYKGEVVRGKQNGRKFGMPTANVNYPKTKINVNQGIYYSYVIYEGKRMPSLTSISTNPTLGENGLTYETYIYDFDKEIYGEEIYVELIEKYRDPVKFESVEQLVDKLQEDKKLGEKYFNLR